MHTITDGICILVLTPQNDGGKMDLTIDCSVCYFEDIFDVSGCDIYEVLGLDTCKKVLAIIDNCCVYFSPDAHYSLYS